MNHRLILGSAFGLCVVAMPAAVLAKPAPARFTTADFVRTAPPIDRGCIFGDAAKTATPAQKIGYCAAGMAEFERLRTLAVTPAEWAGLTYLIASYDFVRAGSYLKVDGKEGDIRDFEGIITEARTRHEQEPFRFLPSFIPGLDSPDTHG